jgi:cytoskeleton protein RodZ
MPVETASGEAEAAESRGPGPGELLRGARCERGLSVEQVAENLHLDESIVEALEAERFDAVGAPVFVRGHLKAYARALQIEADTVLGAYRSTQPVDAAEPVLSRPVPTRSLAINPGPWAMGALGVVLAIGLAFYVLQEDPAPRRAPPPSPAAADTTEPDRVERVVPPPSEAAPPEPVAAAAPPDPPAADLPPPAEPVAILPAPAPAPAASEVPAPPSVAMPAARLEASPGWRSAMRTVGCCSACSGRECAASSAAGRRSRC